MFGFYGTQRYLVTAGRREFAIFAALGAGPRAIGRLVTRRALMFGLPGLCFGAVSGFIVVAWMRDEYVTDVVPPLTVTLLVSAAISALLLAATIAPARAARNTDPGPLLKQE